MKTLATSLATALLAACAATAQAAPYAIRYVGVIDGSTIAGVPNGQSYTVTLIVDNGGTTAASQQWRREHLRCTIWRINTADAPTLRVDLGSHPPSTYGGSVTTAADGTLTGMFTTLVSSGLGAGQYTLSPGLDLPPALTWRIGGTGGQNALYAGGGTANVTTFRDALHGAPSNQPGDWRAPRRLRQSVDPCSDVPGPAVPRDPAAAPGDARLDITWQLPAQQPGDAQVLHYQAEATPDSGGGFAHSCRANHPATACTVSGLVNGTTYRVRVFAVGQGNTVLGQTQDIFAAPLAPGAPGAPTGVTGTPGDGQVTLHWQPPAAGAVPTSYRAQAAPGAAACTALAPATTCTVPGLANGTGYHFTVYAVNAVGESASAIAGPFTPRAGPGPGPGPGGGVQPVPALGLPALALLAAGAAGVGARRLRRKS